MSSRIRGFLLVHPKPHSVRVSRGGGDPEVIAIGKQSFARVAETIDALDVDLVQCLDKDGNILRAMGLGAADERRSDAPALPAGLHADPQALMVTHFANLLHRAYEHSTEIAFSKLVELVDRIGDRAEAIEKRLERTETQYRQTVEQQIADAYERAEEEAARRKEESSGGGFVEQMAGAFLSGQMNGAPAVKSPSSNGSNGKGQA